MALAVVTGIGEVIPLCCCLSDCDDAKDHHDEDWILDTGKIERRHAMFWGVYVASICFWIYMFASPLAEMSSNTSFILIIVLRVAVIHGLPLIVKCVEAFYRCGSGRCAHLVQARRLLTARLFGMALFFVLQQLNVPLAQFFLEAVFQADIDIYFRLMLTLLMIGIQIFAVLAFNFVLIADFAGDEKGYIDLLSSVQTAATSNYEIYRFEYRFWIVFEVFYELINSLWLNIGARGYPDVYWLDVLCHIFYGYIHWRLRPSLYDVHNWVRVSVGVSEFIADIAVLESIYGSGSLSESGVWTFVCGLIPFGVGVLE
jgi:hypothetical protein